MGQYIALYRGINVGGKNPVRMEALRKLHERLGNRQVRSYVQSGNIVFSAAGSEQTIAPLLAAEFADQFGFAARVMVVSARRWQAVVSGNPFAEAAAEPKTVAVAFCDARPDEKALAALLARTGGRERFLVGDKIVYLHTPDGFGTSRFAAGLERAAGTSLTARNWRTVEALAKMVAENGAA